MCCSGLSECWQLLTRCPRTQASQAYFSPLINILAREVGWREEADECAVVKRTFDHDGLDDHDGSRYGDEVLISKKNVVSSQHGLQSRLTRVVEQERILKDIAAGYTRYNGFSTVSAQLVLPGAD